MVAQQKKRAWAVRYPVAERTEVCLSYDRHDTPQEAIRVFEESTGKQWEVWVSQGAEVVEVEIEVR